MPIKKNIKDTLAITAYGKVISRVHAMGRVVWNAVRSCFGAGYWIDDYPWSDTDGWKE